MLTYIHIVETISAKWQFHTLSARDVLTMERLSPRGGSDTDTEKGIVRSVEKCCALLDRLGSAPEGMSLTQVTETLKFPYSTAHRLLGTLETFGYVQRDPDSKRYFLGLHILELQANIAKRFQLLDIALPHMTTLIQEMAITCHLAVLHDADVVYLESRRSHGDPFFHMYTPPGTTAPAYCTALGKTILAHLPPSTTAQLLSAKPLVAMTPNSIVDLAALEQELACIHRRGYAIDNEEYAIGIRCIAAPIRCRTGEVIAALSVSGSRDQIAVDREATLASRVREACNQISRELGFVA